MRSFHRGFIKYGISSAEELAFYEDLDLPPGARAALLEWQLSLYVHTLSKNRHWNSALDSSLNILIKRLHGLYRPATNPIRHLRLKILLLQLSQSNENILHQDIIPGIVDTVPAYSVAGTEDEGLARFEAHLRASLNLKIAMQRTTPLPSSMKESFLSWEYLVDKAASWEAITQRVDDIDSWISDLKTSADFLNAKGEEYLALPVLHLLVKIQELQESPDTSELVTMLCDLALQYLRLGYSGKTGMSLARAESLLVHGSVSMEARLRWHITYAEYLARIGNSVKW